MVPLDLHFVTIDIPFLTTFLQEDKTLSCLCNHFRKISSQEMFVPLLSLHAEITTDRYPKASIKTKDFPAHGHYRDTKGESHT